MKAMTWSKLLHVTKYIQTCRQIVRSQQFIEIKTLKKCLDNVLQVAGKFRGAYSFSG